MTMLQTYEAASVQKKHFAQTHVEIIESHSPTLKPKKFIRRRCSMQVTVPKTCMDAVQMHPEKVLPPEWQTLRFSS
jgi:preprotein translocase subunit Sec63